MSKTLEFEEIYDPREIIKHILESKANETVIGIVSPLLGRVMILTGVEDLILEDVPMLILKPFDTSGNIISTVKIPLTQIQCVKSFKTKFENPLISRFGDNPLSMTGT